MMNETLTTEISITRECITQADKQALVQHILASFEGIVAKFVQNPGTELRIRLLVVDSMEPKPE